MIEKPLHRYGPLDSGSLCKLYRSPDVYIPSADDHTDPKKLQSFVDNCLASPLMFILGVDSRHEAFIFAPAHNASTYLAHLAIRKDKRDGTIPRRVAEAGKWIFQNTSCRAIMCFVREDNKHIRVVLAQVGMKKIGQTKQTVLMDGVWHDELIYQCTIDDYNALWGKELGEV